MTSCFLGPSSLSGSCSTAWFCQGGSGSSSCSHLSAPCPRVERCVHTADWRNVTFSLVLLAHLPKANVWGHQTPADLQLLLLCPRVGQCLGSREIWLREQQGWSWRSGLGVQGSGPSIGNGYPVPSTLCVWCRSPLSCETKAVAVAQGGNLQRSHSLNIQQAGAKKAICTAYQGPFHRWGWKALKCPFKYLSEQAAAIWCSSGSPCNLAPTKAPAACREGRALTVLYQWQPLVHGLSTSWAPLNRKITFLSVPADHKLKGWEVMGNVWHLSQKRICPRVHFSKSCCQDPAALAYSKAAKSIVSPCTSPALSSFPSLPLFSPALLTLLIFFPFNCLTACSSHLFLVVPWRAEQLPGEPEVAMLFILWQTQSLQNRHLLLKQPSYNGMVHVAGFHP